MKTEVLEEIKKRQDKRIRFAFVFGSALTPKFNKLSDVDVCIYYGAGKKERFKFLIDFASSLPEKFEVHIFQDLPIFIRKEVLKGKLIYYQDKQEVYDVAYETIKECEDFKKNYYDYIEREGIEIEK